MKIFFLTLICSSLPFIACTQRISSEQLKSHISWLASDELQGRGTGSTGGEKAAEYLESQFKKIGLATSSNPFTFKGGMHGTGKEGATRNIIAYLDNQAKTTIIIGAHYDHLGLGNDGNSLDPDPKNKIHNGADDNASGVAGILELARYFKKNKLQNSNLLFLAFSGEELGLYGSKYWTEHPTINLNQVNYMINLDMIGRYESSKGLAVSGTGTAPVWEPLLKSLSSEKLIIKTDSSGVGPSDHTSFYLKNIPVLHFFTGSHSDYHKPTDDWDKINYAGEAEILRVIVKVIESPETQNKLAFLTTKNKSMTPRSSFKVTMGVMPSYTAEVVGLRVDGVSEGKPAQKAGILAGDIITKLGVYEVKDIETYMEALGQFDKGQTITVQVKRGAEVKDLTVTF